MRYPNLWGWPVGHRSISSSLSLLLLISYWGELMVWPRVINFLRLNWLGKCNDSMTGKYLGEMKHNDCKSADYCLEKMTDISPVYCCYLTMLNIPKANPPTPSATSNPSIHYALQRIILTCERIFMKQNWILYLILFQSRGKIAPAFDRQSGQKS